MADSVPAQVTRPRSAWAFRSWLLVAFVAGVAVAIAASAVVKSRASSDAPTDGAAAASPDTKPAAAFETPLDHQADTGALAIQRSATPYRTDTFEIHIPSGDEAGHEVEQKLRVSTGDAISYTWKVEGIDNPEEFHADLHGHSPPAPGYREESFRRGGGLQDSGAFVVPFDGIHGWFFKNDSAAAAKVVLQVSGFYTPVSAEELARIEQEAERFSAAP